MTSAAAEVGKLPGNPGHSYFQFWNSRPRLCDVNGGHLIWLFLSQSLGNDSPKTTDVHDSKLYVLRVDLAPKSRRFERIVSNRE